MNTRPTELDHDSPRLLLIRGLAAIDASGIVAGPPDPAVPSPTPTPSAAPPPPPLLPSPPGLHAAVLVRVSSLRHLGPRWRCELLAAGSPAQVARHPLAARAEIIDRPGCILTPALVNAHTHLDLTHIGPQPHDPAAGFTPWVGMVRQRRATTVEDIGRSVLRGAELSLAGGVVAVGDICGAVRGQPTTMAASALVGSMLSGVSFIEFFGIGSGEARAVQALRSYAMEAARSSAEGDPIRLGLQPHAPYSVSLELYQQVAAFAKQLGVRIATHLAESPEERTFITRGSGPFADLLREVGVWDDDLEATFDNPSATPVAWVHAALHQARFLAAHVNDCSDEDLRILKQTRTSVVYCPRASAYFGAERHFGPHRYREMLAAGINVALGTDSIINLEPAAADPAHGISTLDEMRLLFRRDGTDPQTLLAMATTNAARALGLHAPGFTLSGPVGGPIGGVLAIKIDPALANMPHAAIVQSDSRPELLAFGAV